MMEFESINRGYNSVFKLDELSIGLVVPIENYAQNTVPSMSDHLNRALLAEKLGFKAIWLRDVPLHVPSFGDAGQTFDPFTYLGYLAGQTSNIALGIASIALPLRHPLHVLKSATSVDQLSNGRLILGLASGDRPEEYPATGIDFDNRGDLFRDSFNYIRMAQESFPYLSSKYYGELNGKADLLPKAHGRRIPLLLTGHSQQSMEWIAENADGWMYYPRNLYMQDYNVTQWRELVHKLQEYARPFMQPLYIDLQENEDFAPQPIHLGFRIGMKHLIEYVHHLKDIGVHHLALNLRFNSRKIEDTLEDLASKLLPHFHQTKKNIK